MKARSTDAQFAAATAPNLNVNTNRQTGRQIYLEALDNAYYQRHQKRQEQERLQRRDQDSWRRCKPVSATVATA